MNLKIINFINGPKKNRNQKNKNQIRNKKINFIFGKEVSIEKNT